MNQRTTAEQSFENGNLVLSAGFPTNLKSLNLYYETACKAGLSMLQNGNVVPIPLSTQALKIHEKFANDLKPKLQAVLSAARKIVTTLLDENHLSFFDGLSIDELSFAKAHPWIPLATTRFDSFLTQKGIQLFEFNSTIPAMQGYADIASETFLDLNAKKDKVKYSCSEHLLKTILRSSIDISSILIVCRPGDSQIEELKYVAKNWRLRNLKVEIAQSDNVKQVKEKFSFQNHLYDCVYRHIFFNLIPGTSELRKACFLNAGNIFNPVAAHYEVKSLFAFLYTCGQNKYFARKFGVTENEAAAISGLIPFTKIYSKKIISMYADVFFNHEKDLKECIIKKNRSYGGRDIFLEIKGDLLSEEQKDLWIIQERLLPTTVQHQWVGLQAGNVQVFDDRTFFDLGIFCNWSATLTDMDISFVSRFSRSVITNLGKGGGLIPCIRC